MPRTLPALAAITGAFFAMGVAASGAAAFHHYVVQGAQPAPGADHISIHVTSVQEGSPLVYADIHVTATAGTVRLGGDISPVTIYNGTHAASGAQAVPAGSMVAISYAGMLETAAAVSPGDVIYVRVGHPGGEDILAVPVR